MTTPPDSATDQALDDDALPRWLRYDVLLAVFVGTAVAAGVITQEISSRRPNLEGAPIEAFTAGFLWMASMFGFYRAVQSAGNHSRFIFWALFAAGSAALAFDEHIGVHERVEPSIINDDLLKVVMWLATPVVLVFIARIENASPFVRSVMAMGYGFHALYILVETGDGEFFELYSSVSTLKYLEEVFELLFLACYVYALWYLLLRSVHEPELDREEPGPVGVGSSAAIDDS